MPGPMEVKKEKEAIVKKGRKTATNLLFHIKPVSLLVLLLHDKVWNVSSLARESNQSYVYAVEVVKIFEEEGIVNSNSKGKRRIIKLTEKGEKIAKVLNEVLTTHLAHNTQQT